jgi:hypothetical protein
MADKKPAASFRELQWLAKYYEEIGDLEKARAIRDNLVNIFVKNSHHGEVVQIFPDEEKQA